MDNKDRWNIPEIYIPKGYELEDMLETDTQGYEPVSYTHLTLPTIA